MVVRLLPKSEIDRRKSEEQRTAIQEGLKVAERVDLLREMLASEETAFDKYRTDTLKAIQSEVNEKHQEKNVLEGEVVVLRRERKELLIPLDAKWDEVNRAQKICNEWQSDLDMKESELASKSTELINRERETLVKEGKAEDLSKLASATFTEARNILASAKEESADMRNKAQVELSYAELKQIDVRKRELDATIKEHTLTEKESRIDKYEADLAKREQVLRAGWKNLERTKNKLNL